MDSCKANTPWEKWSIVPKILVTVDSYLYVAEELEYLNILQEFTVVVDEFHCLLSDSKFKGRTDIEFLHNLSGVDSICYLSATPIDESYLNQIPEFSDVDHYIKLVWPASAIEKPNLLMIPFGSRESSNSICQRIIQKYRDNGYFERKRWNGAEVFSREAVFFLNDVKAILQIIKANNLNPAAVNVLCSASNKYLSKLKALGVGIGLLAENSGSPVNRTFTFATRASFEGVDFYSDNAMTYIFSDGMLDWRRNDLITDVPQILGRQRLVSNPFRKDAILYYRPDYKADAAAKELIIHKSGNTDRWIDKYNQSDAETQMMLKDGVMKRADDLRYNDDYVEFVDDKRGGYVLKKNSLAMFTEIRDWELSTFVYQNQLSIVTTMAGNTGIQVASTCGVASGDIDETLSQFYRQYHELCHSQHLQ